MPRIFINITTEDGELLDRFAIDKEGVTIPCLSNNVRDVLEHRFNVLETEDEQG